VSGSLGQMWSMINAFQIVQSFNYLNVNSPGNVVLAMKTLDDMLSLTAIPTEQFLIKSFNFTETESPGPSFDNMGDNSKSLVLFLGNVFIIGLIILAIYLIYGFVNCCRNVDIYCKKMDLWLFPKLIWGTLFVYQLESQLDYCIGTMLRLEELHFDTPGDIFDFVAALVSIICLVVLPLTEIIGLSKNKDKMDKPSFKSKWGSLYPEIKTFTFEQRTTAI